MVKAVCDDKKQRPQVWARINYAPDLKDLLIYTESKNLEANFTRLTQKWLQLKI